MFASRRAYKLAYVSQRDSGRGRALNRAFRLRRRLGADGGIGDYIEKPKWMRRRTFDRYMARVEAAEAVVNGQLWEFIERLERRGRR